MIRVHMGVDHVADRPIGLRTDGGLQRRSDPGSASSVDHRDGIIADDERLVGNVAMVRRRINPVNALGDKNAGRNLLRIARR